MFKSLSYYVLCWLVLVLEPWIGAVEECGQGRYRDTCTEKPGSGGLCVLTVCSIKRLWCGGLASVCREAVWGYKLGGESSGCWSLHTLRTFALEPKEGFAIHTSEPDVEYVWVGVCQFPMGLRHLDLAGPVSTTQASSAPHTFLLMSVFTILIHSTWLVHNHPLIRNTLNMLLVCVSGANVWLCMTCYACGSSMTDVWGLFSAYLFVGSGSATQVARLVWQVSLSVELSLWFRKWSLK